MTVFIYVVARDYGFAPNPFYGICTLATCKPGIRKSAGIGDWIFGIGSKSTHPNRLVYLMKVTQKITFNEYWENVEYARKKPQMTTLKKMYGDNIYYFENGVWYQANSHHSYEDGKTNPINLEKDTGSDNVLISREFFYFGKNAILIPEKFATAIYKSGRGYRKEEESELINEFLQYIRKNYKMGYMDDPILFTRFRRYNGLA
ncbi:MAG: hypothetical protein M0022_09130 [Desulfobacteraceae bacterium]|nr:hypothetical protein [Desulfobacteraceae bacterium]